MHHLLRCAFALLCVALLPACGPQVRSTSIDAEAGVPAGNGLVVVQAVTNAELLTPQLPDFTSVMAAREGEPDALYEMTRQDRGLLRSGVFVGSLPPGRYRLSHLHAFGSNGSAQFWLNAPIPALIGTFEVQSGRLTRLGTLLVQPLTAGPTPFTQQGTPNAPYVMSRVDAASGLDDYVRARYPEPAQAALQSPVLGWNEDAHDATRQRLAARIREFALGDQPLHLGEDIVIPARLGQLQWRGANGWKRIETGHTQQLAAAARIGAGVLVGGERGLMLAAPALEGPWRVLAGPSPDEAIYWIGAAPAGQAFVLTRSGTESRAYRIDPENPQWTPLKRFTYEPGFFFTGRGVMHARVDGDELVLLYNKEQHRLRADGTWVTGESTRVLWRLHQQPDGALVGLGGSLWSGVGEPEVSDDGGATWRRVIRPQPGFSLDDLHLRWNYFNALPVRLADGSIVVPGARQTRDARGKVSNAPEPYLLRSAPGEKGWRVGPALATGCYRLLPSISSDAALYALCIDGRVVRSGDLGRTWQTDLESGQARLAEEPEAT